MTVIGCSARLRLPEERPLTKTSSVSLPFCALVNLVGPIFLVWQFFVLGKGLDPAVSLVCIAPRDGPSGQPLWRVCGTAFDRQGSTILQQTAATDFSIHALTLCDCARPHNLAKFWHQQDNSGTKTPNRDFSTAFQNVHFENLPLYLRHFLNKRTQHCFQDLG